MAREKLNDVVLGLCVTKPCLGLGSELLWVNSGTQAAVTEGNLPTVSSQPISGAQGKKSLTLSPYSLLDPKWIQSLGFH